LHYWRPNLFVVVSDYSKIIAKTLVSDEIILKNRVGCTATKIGCGWGFHAL
jgi:hypothetical protein